MNIVEFNKDKHYNIMCNIWKSIEWTPCPIDALPKHGRVVEDENNTFIAFMAIYIEAETIAVIDWALANPLFIKEKRHIALQLLFETLVSLAKKQGCNYIYSFTKNENWGNKLESYGMLPAERGATSYILPINNKDISFISD